VFNDVILEWSILNGVVYQKITFCDRQLHIWYTIYEKVTYCLLSQTKYVWLFYMNFYQKQLSFTESHSNAGGRLPYLL